MTNGERVGYLIHVIGMDSFDMHDFEADGQWLLHHLEPEHTFVPILLPPDWRDNWTGWARDLPASEAASLFQAMFLADCISYDHDVPTVVSPAVKGQNIPPPVTPVGADRSWIDAGDMYYDHLMQAYESAASIRFPDGLQLRYEWEGDPLTRFGLRFTNRGEPLKLYAMSLRQVDVLSEYLCLYRVLEWPNRDNGIEFINSHLEVISEYDFGSLNIRALPGDEQIDVFETYRERATGRIGSLRTADVDIAQRLYQFRNSLAHGKENVAVQDFGEGADAISAELPLIKLLARMAVESSGSAAEF